MLNINQAIVEFYRSGELKQRLLAGLKLSGRELCSLTADDLIPVDAFHLRGRSATIEAARLVNVEVDDFVLDVGCGLGGTVRYLADKIGCQTIGLDLTPEYITVGRELNKLVDLHERVELYCGNALEMPFEDRNFNVVWTEHVQMNIQDKKRFYTEISRVMTSDGRLLFHDLFRCNEQSLHYPTPWAGNESISILATEEEMRSTTEQAGLEIDQWIDKTEESAEFLTRVLERFDADGFAPLGLHLLMGENTKGKLSNLLRNINNNSLSVVIGVACRKQ